MGGISSVHPKLSSLTHPSTMHRLIGALLFGIIGLSQGTPPATPVSSPPVPPPGLRYRPYRPPPSPFGGMGADPLTLSLLLGGGLGRLNTSDLNKFLFKVVQEVLLILFFLYCCLGEVKAVSEVSA